MDRFDLILFVPHYREGEWDKKFMEFIQDKNYEHRIDYAGSSQATRTILFKNIDYATVEFYKGFMIQLYEDNPKRELCKFQLGRYK